MFLEKTKLKDGSNDADWIRDLGFILIAAQKNYVLDAPLGDKPIVGADADVGFSSNFKKKSYAHARSW